MYALVDRSRQHDLAALRSFHDHVLKPVIQSAEGVAEIASVGGHVKQIQILANQAALQTYNTGQRSSSPRRRSPPCSRKPRSGDQRDRGARLATDCGMR